MGIRVYRAKHKIRFVTASSLFDGHDAAINIMRRILQSSGAEVIHLGHNRSVAEIVRAAIQEDVQGIAVSSYQGGHMEFFPYMYDLLKERGAGHIRIFGGGGGVILPREIRELEDYGITKIFSPEDGRKMGLQGMANHMLERCDFVPPIADLGSRLPDLFRGVEQIVARFITLAELFAEGTAEGFASDAAATKDFLFETIRAREKRVPVIGITGTGGAGKSSLTDELVRRFLNEIPGIRIAILSVDPTKQKTGGALLGDRIRMNSIFSPRVYMRSLATRHSRSELPEVIEDALSVVRSAQFDLVFVETSGIGQGDAEIKRISDISVYVMTGEFGAPTQLEKIDMIDFADFVVINKFDKKGSEDARRLVQKQYQRSHGWFDENYENMPVYGTIASQFNDPGTDTFFVALLEQLNKRFDLGWRTSLSKNPRVEKREALIPPRRQQYLREIADTVREYRNRVREQEKAARKLFQIEGALEMAKELGGSPELIESLEQMKKRAEETLSPETKRILKDWEERKEKYGGDELVVRIHGKEQKMALRVKSLSGLSIPKIALPKFKDYGEIVRWMYLENVPGSFPFTAGVFPFKRTGEEPMRQFAGEGTPEQTNRRFHYLSRDSKAKRLSTAFDSVTLYGEDPDERRDIYGKIGESGVSVCTLDDMKKLYRGFDLCHPLTSVSMTINGPAPILLAMFFNTAIDQQVEKREAELGRKLSEEEYEKVKEQTLSSVRGTVQADILKEDQGQNTCIFSTEFALRMMGDIQQYFIDHHIRNYYSVSISGYHIAEAGANPITQLAFTLANGFTYVEYFLSRGMHIDDFAPNLSFFFSNGLDPEYSVLGRVARRIWAIVIKEKYGGNERSQKLKYHIQTSGRSLHAQEMAFNDIRTTLQALMALYDNCNSLHTNAYDEAVTTPTEESVRRAMAIQLIISQEHGLSKNENPMQGSFLIEELTDLVEEAVLAELDRLNDRGGVLGAMESQYQRSKIQDESLLYESKKHSGELPIIGVNTFLNPNPDLENRINQMPLARATKEAKDIQIANLRAFQERNRSKAGPALERLKKVAVSGGNIFEELMETVKVASLGQITRVLYEVGGKYRRNI